MAKKPSTELPLGAAPGVAPLKIPLIAKAVEEYETAKRERCNASPGEIAAKQKLKGLLVANRDKLPLNELGLRYYRHEGVDYVLEEVLKRHTAEASGGDDE
jgi:hypothetical protein